MKPVPFGYYTTRPITLYERIRGSDIPLHSLRRYYNGATIGYKLHEVMPLF